MNKRRRTCDPHGIPVARGLVPLSCGAPGPVCLTAGFSTTNKLVSRIIRFLTRGRVSHAWIAYDNAVLGLRMVMQAERWGFEERPWLRWRRENHLVAEFEVLVSESQQLHAVRTLARHLGEKYDWRGGFWAGVAAWLKRWVKVGLSLRPKRTPSKLMCAEAQIVCLKAAGVEAIAGCYEETTNPEDLLVLLEKSVQMNRVYPR